jgi:L-malate glycosyltransferase
MNRKITILHVIESLGLGGAEKAVVQAVNGNPEYRHIVAILHGPDVLKSQLKEAPFLNLEAVSVFDRVKAVSKLRKTILENKVDIVHAQLFNSTIVGRMASRGICPFVFTLQSMLGEDLFKKNYIARMVEKFTYSEGNYIIAVSNEALSDYRKYISANDRKATVIYNCIEENFFTDSFKRFVPGKKLRMVAVGNLKPLKNHEYILDALKHLPSGDFQLDIYGEGVQHEHLQNRINAEHLPAALMGNVSDLDKRLKDYDIYLHCSKYEGSSLAVFEAMASGLPLIVSNIPVLIENTGGFATYVDLSDPSDLASKLKNIRNGTEDINSQGEKGFEWVRTVAHPEVSRKQTVSIYEEMLATKVKSR